ncbi:MAG TPA: hypothetical protein VF322_13305 [Gammaproteobacteria bacterium]
MPWLLAATVRSLAGAPPTPPDYYREPVRVSDTLRFRAIVAGHEHTCALTIDGATYCWGSNRYEQLGPAAAVTGTCGDGPGTFSCSAEPVRVPGAPPFTALAASRWSTCGLDSSGAAHCWGYGLGGRDERGFPASSGVPVTVPAEHAFVALAAGASSDGTCGLTANGDVWCWTWPAEGARGASAGVFAGPDPVAAPVKFAAISFGGGHGCGIATAGGAYCWGNNVYGALGTGASWHEGGVRQSPAAVLVQGGVALRHVVAGSGYSCGLDAEGAAYCWGQGYPVDGEFPEFQRLSAGPLPHGSLPVPLDARGSRWVALGAAVTRACGLAEDGRAHCFSTVPLGRVDRRPAAVNADQRFVALAVGGGHVCALGTDALAYCWGDGYAGQVGRAPSGRRW